MGRRSSVLFGLLLVALSSCGDVETPRRHLYNNGTACAHHVPQTGRIEVMIASRCMGNEEVDVEFGCYVERVENTLRLWSHVSWRDLPKQYDGGSDPIPCHRFLATCSTEAPAGGYVLNYGGSAKLLTQETLAVELSPADVSAVLHTSVAANNCVIRR